MRPTILFFSLILGARSITFAQSVQFMLSACRSITTAEITEGKVNLPQDFRSGMCWGAFTVLQEVARHTYDENHTFYRACLPPESTRTQMIAVFVAYAEKNPQRLHEDFVEFALHSLKESFPCKGESNPKSPPRK